MLGIDYASVDGNAPPDFARLKAAGYSFVYLRAAWGTWADPDYRRDADAAKAAGLAVGRYLFLRYPEHGRPAPSPEAQAHVFLDTGCAACTLPDVVDVEFPGRGLVDTNLTPAGALDVIERAVGLVAQAGEVMIYTSARVWEEDLGNIAAPSLGAHPLWIKTPYTYKPREPVNPAVIEAVAVRGYVSTMYIPPPWHAQAWIQQFQGDAVGIPGLSATADVNRFLPARAGKDGHVPNTDPRATWIHSRTGGLTIPEFQRVHGLVPDGVVGPVTFAVLCKH